MDEAGILKLLEKITAAYPNFELTEERIELWNESLRGFYPEEAAKNLNAHILTNHFPPTVADITQMSGNMEGLRRMFWEDRCEEAIGLHLTSGGTMDTFDQEGWRIKIKFAKFPRSELFFENQKEARNEEAIKFLGHGSDYESE
jgi:hypothetical protein